MSNEEMTVEELQEAIADHWGTTPDQVKIEAKYFLENFMREEF